MSEDIVQDQLATLKARADLMGIAYHPSIGVDKLREKVAAAQAGRPEVTQENEIPAAVAPAVQVQAPQPQVETLGQRKQRMKKEANALVRIRLTCMNPGKKDWPGEIITVGNSLVGSVSKFIPFNADEGWHVPQIMLSVLQARQCQIFTTSKAKNGVTVRQGKMIKEFAIEILPHLTTAELHDLAQRQAMAGSIE